MALADNTTMAELANVYARELRSLEAACTLLCSRAASHGGARIENRVPMKQFWENPAGRSPTRNFILRTRDERGTSL